jgi:AmiR/NasT family two-component response regulator
VLARGWKTLTGTSILSGMEKPLASSLQRQIDELVALVGHNTEQIDVLTAGAHASDERAVAAQQRADAAQLRVDRMEARSVIDRAMIARLEAEGAVSRDHIAQLEAAIGASRRIGAALGILMVSRRISEDEALTVLRGASERTRMSVEHLAATIVAGANTLT